MLLGCSCAILLAMKVLVVEDDKATAELIRSGLDSYSHTADISTDGADGSFMVRTYDYDAIVLDYSLPKKDGFIVCKDIRTSGKSVPIIFLSSTDDTDTKVKALEYGADDYMTKPFSLNELQARLTAITRRPQHIKQAVFTIDSVVLDQSKQTVTRDEELIRLTRKEFNLLEYLMRSQGTIISRTLIIEHVWTADSDPFSNTVETHIRNIRKKLNVGNKANIIGNVLGRGYIADTPLNLKKIGAI
jgi:DNA-binding response OmpR family regulator